MAVLHHLHEHPGHRDRRRARQPPPAVHRRHPPRVRVRNTTDADILVQGYAITVDNEGRLPWEHQVSIQDRDSVDREVRRRVERQEPGISIWNFMRIPARSTASGWYLAAVTRIPTGGSPACTIVVRDEMNNTYQKAYPKEGSRSYET